MSTPQWIFINCEEDGSNMVSVDLPKPAGTRLTDYMLPRIEVAAPGWGEVFEADTYCGSLSIIEIPAEYYHAVYDLIMEACDKHHELDPYRAELKAALEADPRFKQAA